MERTATTTTKKKYILYRIERVVGSWEGWIRKKDADANGECGNSKEEKKTKRKESEDKKKMWKKIRRDVNAAGFFHPVYKFISMTTFPSSKAKSGISTSAVVIIVVVCSLCIFLSIGLQI